MIKVKVTIDISTEYEYCMSVRSEQEPHKFTPNNPDDVMSNIIILLSQQAPPSEFSAYFAKESMGIQQTTKMQYFSRNNEAYAFATGKHPAPYLSFEQDSILSITSPTVHYDSTKHVFDINIYLGRALQPKHSEAFQRSSPIIALTKVEDAVTALSKFFTEDPNIAGDFWHVSGVPQGYNNTDELALELATLLRLPGSYEHTFSDKTIAGQQYIFFPQWKEIQEKEYIKPPVPDDLSFFYDDTQHDQ